MIHSGDSLKEMIHSGGLEVHSTPMVLSGISSWSNDWLGLMWKSQFCPPWYKRIIYQNFVCRFCIPQVDLGFVSMLGMKSICKISTWEVKAGRLLHSESSRLACLPQKPNNKNFKWKWILLFLPPPPSPAPLIISEAAGYQSYWKVFYCGSKIFLANLPNQLKFHTLPPVLRCSGSVPVGVMRSHPPQAFPHSDARCFPA